MAETTLAQLGSFEMHAPPGLHGGRLAPEPAGRQPRPTRFSMDTMAPSCLCAWRKKARRSHSSSASSATRPRKSWASARARCSAKSTGISAWLSSASTFQRLHMWLLRTVKRWSRRRTAPALGNNSWSPSWWNMLTICAGR